MAQPDSLTQGLAAFMGGIGGQVQGAENRSNAEDMQNRARAANAADRMTAMKQQEGFQKSELDSRTNEARRTQALGLYQGIANAIGAFTEKDPAKQNILLQRAEDIMKQHYAPAYGYLVSTLGKSGLPAAPQAASASMPMQDGVVGAVNRTLFGQNSGSMPADSFSTAFPKTMGAFQNNGLEGGSLMAPYNVPLDLGSGLAEMAGNSLGLGQSRPMHPMASLPQSPSSIQPPVAQAPTPQMSQPSMAPTQTPAPFIANGGKVKLRKKL